MEIKEQKLITLKSLYGFGIYILERHEGVETFDGYLKGEEGPKLFGNREMARHYAKTKLRLFNAGFELHVIKFNYRTNSVNLIAYDTELEQFEPGLYMVAKEDVWYYIREVRTDRVQSIRYLQFGEKKMVEENYGIAMNQLLFGNIKEAATSFLWYSGLLDTVRCVGDRELEVAFKNSTTKIYIMSNHAIAQFNIARKSLNFNSTMFTRALPFIRGMDNFMSFYCYVCKDNVEPNDGMGFEGRVNDDVERFFQYIIDYLWDYTMDDTENPPSYVTVDFGGTILIRR